MWCTRWFLPLFLLPIPTASPYFLLLFLFSLTTHARPCFYCIVLLSALFLSSCYWHPFPIDSPLSSPWSSDITTFSEALSASLGSAQVAMPPVIRAIDRCWCDLASGTFFEPFNVTRWEHASVERLKGDLERRKAVEEALKADNETLGDPADAPTLDGAEGQMQKLLTGERAIQHSGQSIWSALRYAFQKSRLISSSPAETISPDPETFQQTPILRTQYDLRSHGFDVIVDFGWS